MTVDLQNISAGGDMRSYPWQRLVNAVRRACNLRVAPPLEMLHGSFGTTIRLTPTLSDLVSLQSASTDIVLSDSPIVATLGGATPVLPEWLSITDGELIVGDSAAGAFIQFGGCLGVKKIDPATESSAARIVLEYWFSDFAGFSTLWHDHLYLAADDANAFQRRTPSCCWGPIKAGDKFRVTAMLTAGNTDRVVFIGGVTEMRLDLHLLRARGVGVRSN